MFKAILIQKLDDQYAARLTELQDDQLPAGNVTVKVAYSTLNYKDALAITGKGPVVRQFPMVPGIDLAGTVEASDDPRYQPGDRVLLNGWGVGESHWGGLAQKARLNGDWLIPHPERLNERQTMAIGTAGYTAMLCLMALERHGMKPSHGPVLVTGATGGVGSYAINLLAGAGYTVTAATGKASEEDYLKSLGATAIIDRAELSAPGVHWQKKNGQPLSTRSAAIRWPMRAQAQCLKAWSLRVDWPREWISRQPLPPSFFEG